MEARELRVGNYLRFSDTEDSEPMEHSVIVTGIFDDSIYFADFDNIEAGDLTIDLLKPIPLTEEWLLKFGFEQEVGIMSYKLNGVQIVWETLAKFYRLYPKTHPIKYVHQLQNLYFALTGTELILK